MEILETNRLSLREFTLSDGLFIIQLVNTDGWVRHIGRQNMNTIEDAKEYLLEGPVKSYRQNGFGVYLVCLRTSEIPVGMCGLVKRDFLDAPDIGFAFLPEHQGRGYAFEASEAVLTYAMTVLNYPKIYAITSKDNQNAINLLKKLRMHEVESVNFPNSTEELARFAISK